MGLTSSTPLPQEITTLITSKAKRLVGWYRFTESDQEEIEQAIKLEVVRRRSTVGEARAQHMGFLICLVEHAVYDIIAARKACNRDYRREAGSLDQWTHDASGEWATRGETVGEEEAGRRVERPGTSQDTQDLAIDLAEAASRLSPRQREILQHYAVLGSAREVAKATGLHHSTVCDAMKQIKRHFEAVGLDGYLPKPRSTPTDSDARRLVTREPPNETGSERKRP